MAQREPYLRRNVFDGLDCFQRKWLVRKAMGPGLSLTGLGLVSKEPLLRSNVFGLCVCSLRQVEKDSHP